ncbi:TCR/Tet family MFS transporter [Parahaliea maris]|uniref:TCR/Tet family MFS transporter n=1 Tax=Parahaliea maris TaxID=2716870 RepID=A0A5C8ZZE4_9GAMM|nr:MFS transporter [Parahaliea maris]TXS93973.1 TCR/Tet family MFS transporter [Parahaliea maris]
MPILFGVVLLDLIGFGIVIPILPFLSPELGASKMDIALIIVAYAVGAGLCGGWWGRLSDRVGRKRVIMICLAGAALGYVFLGLASELWMVYAARAFSGLMAGNFGVASAMVADLTRPEQRARGMGMIGAAWGLGIMLGPFLGGLLAGGSGDFTLPCIAAGGMSALAIIAAALFLPESVSAERRAANREAQRSSRGGALAMLRDTGNRLLVLQYVLHNTVASSFTYLVPLWTGDLLGWGAREVGILFGIQGGIMVVLQAGLLGPLVRLLGEWRLLRLMITQFLCGVLLALFANGAVAMAGAVFIAMSGGTLCMPLLNTITSQRTPTALRGRMLGTTSAAASWGRVCGPLMGGVCLFLFGYTGAWIACALVLCAYLSWALLVSPRRRPLGNG